MSLIGQAPILESRRKRGILWLFTQPDEPCCGVPQKLEICTHLAVLSLCLPVWP